MNNGTRFAMRKLLKEKWLMLFWIVLSLITAIIPSILVYLNKMSIDNISKLQSDNSILNICVKIIIYIYIINIFNYVIELINNFIYSKIKRNINFNLQHELYKKLSIIPFNNYDDNEFYNKVRLAGQAIQKNGVDIVKYIVELFKNFITIVTLIGLLLSINKALPLILLGSTIPGIVVLFIAKNLRYKVDEQNSEDSRKCSYLSGLFMSKPYLKEMNIFKFDKYVLNKWSSLFKKIMKKELKVEMFESVGQFGGVFVLESISVIFSVFLLYKISKSLISIGDFVSLTSAIIAVQTSIAMMGSSIGEIFEINLYNKAFLQILNYELTDSNMDSLKIDEVKKIEFKEVSFKYPNSEKYVLKKINLVINKGDTIAIVGENGSGKSTLVNLILGLYDNYEGEILINGVNMKKIEKNSYINNISVILQEFIRYNLSLRENISLSNVSKVDNDEQIISNIKNVGFFNKFDKFKYGLETYLTKEYKDGEELSGGQWQKIAIARGVFKESNVIILDEPTAALDPLSELEIFNLFKDVSRRKTAITISHRLGITRYSNKIFVLENGIIIENGTHNELFKLKSKYYELYSSQSGWYKKENVIV